ncbi:Alkaline shock protein 23 [compost metagenome]
MDVSVIIEYGNRLPEVAAQIQHNVKRSIETMTGLNVVEVNVHIHDVQFKSAVEKVEETDLTGRVK